MFLLVLPLGMGIVTRLALRPRGQQRQPLTIDLSAGWLAGIWIFVPVFTIWTMMKAEMFLGSAAILTGTAIAAGILLPEIFRGLGSATANFFGSWQRWLWMIIFGTVLYGLFVDSQVLEGLLTLGIMFLFLGFILGIFPKKKGGGKKK